MQIFLVPYKSILWLFSEHLEAFLKIYIYAHILHYFLHDFLNDIQILCYRFWCSCN